MKKPNRFFDSVLDWFSKTDRTALLALIVANLLPLILCLPLGWDIGNLIFFYWCENLVIGGYSILRLLLAQGKSKTDMPRGIPVVYQNIFLAGFFTVHYFMFCFVHGIFLMLFLSSGFPNNFDSPFQQFAEFWAKLSLTGGLALLALVASHGISFARNYILNRAYVSASSHAEMFKPYGRIVLLHICIMIGGFTIMGLGSSRIFVVVFVLFKTLVDAIMHSRSHALESSTSPS